MHRPRYSPNPDVIETDLDDELILLDPSTQEMFSLNDTGRAIWRALPEHTVESIAERLAADFEIEPDAAEADVRALVSELLEADLVRPVDGAPGDDGPA